MDNTALSHHGILGMKWGVRRYQNYDGSYTKKGLERYRKAESDYKTAKTTYKSNKTKANAVNLKKAKKELNRSYDRLKKDKLADQGKDLYSRGKTITGGTRVSALTQTLIVAGSAVANRILRQYANTNVANIASASIAIGGTAVNAIVAGKNLYEAKRLRAYYGHHS